LAVVGLAAHRQKLDEKTRSGRPALTAVASQAADREATALTVKPEAA